MTDTLAEVRWIYNGSTRRKSMEPWIKDDTVFYDHQVKGVRQLARQKSFILGDDMGLGKSLQALTVFAIDIVRGFCDKAIVICPSSLKGNWADEIVKFTGIQYMILAGTPAKRRDLLEDFNMLVGPKILIVNYEQIQPHLGYLNSIRFDVAIFDEAHYIKNYKAKRTKSSHDLFSRRSFMLTGTPLLNRVNELWSLLHRCDPNKFKSYYNFTHRYCNTPDAPVWMADGSFKPIGEVQVGDKIMGWTRIGSGRKMRVPSLVEEVRRRIAPQIIQVTLESGRVIKCTPDHKWLTMSHAIGKDVWRSIGKVSGQHHFSGGLRILSNVITPTPDLDPDVQRDFDWLMGIYDGEGSNSYIAQSPTHNPQIYSRIQEVLDSLGIPYRADHAGIDIKGGLQTYVNILNWSRNTSFCKRSYFEQRVKQGIRGGRGEGFGGQLNRTADKITSIEPLGPGEVVSMQTETGNYVAWGYASKNCVFGGYNNKEIIATKNEAELKAHLANYMLRRMKSEVLDLPEVQIWERRVDLLPEQQKLYDEVADELKLTVLGEESPQDVENALTKFLRLKQICGTTFPFSGEDHSGKLDLAFDDDFELLARGERVVIFTQFRAVQACYANRLRSAGIDVWDLTGDTPADRRSEIVKEWSSSSMPGALVCMLQVAGVGLNMTAARHGSLLDLLFTPGMNQQAIDRLHRIGSSTTQPIQIRKYICRNTVENRVNQILSSKEALGRNILGGESMIDFKKKILRAMREDLAA